MKNVAPRLPAGQYEKNFADIQGPLTSEQAITEASRCLFCFEAPCITACPTHIDVPGFIKKIFHDNVKGAARFILDANPLGGSCARVCPVEALCEGACVLNHNQEKPIEIGRLQRYATDWFYERGRPQIFDLPPSSGSRVALIGGGPSSLGCAAELRKLGHQAVIYERSPQPGGLNTYGIAQYKMTPQESLNEIEFIRSLGVEFRTNVSVGEDVQVADLLRDYDAVFLGVGLGGTRKIGVPGEHLKGVFEALNLIRNYKTKPYGDVRVGRRVAVVGAGNTAIDAATAAVRLGAETTYIIYRRSVVEMPAYQYEYELGKKDGVVFKWLTAPVEILGKEAVEGLRCVTMKLGPPDERGRSTPEPIPGSEFVLEVDMVIGAVGQEKLIDWLSRIDGLKLHRGCVVVDPETGMSSVPGLFAGGDCVNGGLEVVNAVAEGKHAATGIHRYISECVST